LASEGMANAAATAIEKICFLMILLQAVRIWLFGQVRTLIY
jgi:hypothetical protein